MIERLAGADGALIEGFDVCIVGSGAAGLTLAAQFLDSAVRVLVLESGLAMQDPAADALNDACIVGMRHDGASAGRVRAFGGTTSAWGGQLMRLRASEIAARPWIPDSGWPIEAAELDRWYARAEALMGVPGPPYDQRAWQMLGLPPLALDPEKFVCRFSQWAPLGRRNLAVLLRRRLAAARNVTVLLDATVVGIQVQRAPAGVTWLDVRRRDGGGMRVAARHYVLACGAIETPRLLLASGGAGPGGVANSSGLVGKYFQDHVSFRAAEILPASRRQFGAIFDPRYAGRTMRTLKIEPADGLQARHGLLNAMGHVAFEIHDALGLLEARKLVRELQRGRLPMPSMDECIALARGVGTLSRIWAARAFLRRRRAPGQSRVTLLVDVEQAPSSASRISLSGRRDAFGVPLAAIDWRIGEPDLRTLETYTRMLGAELERLGIGQLRYAGGPDFELRDSPGAARDTYHPLGTTRMSIDPARGVVDPDLRSHDLRNLWIAGGSVFPCGGIANPTLTIMALAIRLSEKLRSALPEGATDRPISSEIHAPRACAPSASGHGRVRAHAGGRNELR